jgi:streptomycin 6-kinase
MSAARERWRAEERPEAAKDGSELIIAQWFSAISRAARRMSSNYRSAEDVSLPLDEILDAPTLFASTHHDAVPRGPARNKKGPPQRP